MFSDLSIGHILVILVILGLVFGAKRLPEIGGALGKSINEFKRNLSDEPAGPASGARTLQPPVGHAASAADEPKKLSQ